MPENTQNSAERTYLPAERQDAILTLLTRQQTVKIPELAQLLNTTEITVRRDLAQLAQAGLIRRVRGGAMSIGTPGRADAITAQPAVQSTLSSKVGQANHPSEPPTKGTIGLMLPEPSFLWPRVVDAITVIAGEHRLQVTASESSYASANEVDLLNELASQDGTVGLIVAPTPNAATEERVWSWIRDADIPVVVTERTHPACARDFFPDSVQTNHAHGSWKAYWHFADRGHTRVAAAFTSSPTSALIEAGWRSAVDSGERIECPFIATDVYPYSSKDVNRVVERIIASSATGVFVHSDYLAIAIAQSLEQHGKRVPNDISLISVDGFAAMSSRPITVIRSSPRLLGQLSLRLLMWRINHPGELTRHISFDPQLVDNGSVTHLNA